MQQYPVLQITPKPKKNIDCQTIRLDGMEGKVLTTSYVTHHLINYQPLQQTTLLPHLFCVKVNCEGTGKHG